MLRKLSKNFVLMFFLIVFIVSCKGTGSDPGSGVPDVDNNPGMLFLSIESQSMSKTIIPEISMDISSHDIHGSGPSGETFDRNDEAVSIVLIENLIPGSWAISVNAKNADGTVIGAGTQNITITAGEVTDCTITVTPVDGTGSLTLSISWPTSVENPVIDATLTPASGTAFPVTFSVDETSGSASYSAPALDNGYYQLDIKLLDDTIELWGYNDSVRIITGENTSGTFVLTEADITSSSVGNVNITINNDLKNPIGISFSGEQATLSQGSNLTVSVTTSDTVDTYQWYLNGNALTGENSDTLTIGSALITRKHNINIIVTKGDIISGAGFSVVVIDSSLPVETATALNYVDTDMSINEYGGKILLTKADDENNISGYRLYYGSSSTVKLDGQPPITTLIANGNNHIYTIPDGTTLPLNATHFLVYTLNVNGESTVPVAFEIVDSVHNNYSIFNPKYFAEYNEKTYFAAQLSSTWGEELYVQNGTSITLVDDIYTNSTSSFPKYLTVFNNKLFFQARSMTQGIELLMFDGTSVTVVADINIGGGHSSPGGFTEYNNKLYFQANDGVNGIELWVYDGTAVSMVADINSGSSGSSPSSLTVYNNKLYFQANDGIHGTILWMYDGVIPTMVVSASAFLAPANMIVYNNKLYFQANDGIHGTELCVYDGTSATMVTDIYIGSSSSNPSYFVEYNNKLYFSAINSIGSGIELWEYDGSSTTMISDIHPGPSSSSPKYLTVYHNKLFFQAVTNIYGSELWAYDGSNVTLINDIYPSSASSYPSYLTVCNDRLYFSAQTPGNAARLFYFWEQ